MRRALRATATAIALASGASALSATGCSTAGLRDAYTALDESGLRRRDVFFTDGTVLYCVAEVSSGREDLTVDALIRQTVAYDEAADKTTEVDIVAAIASSGPGRAQGVNVAVSLTPANADGTPNEDGAFPVGEYLCEIYLDGELEASVPFRIDFPSCPAYAIAPNSACQGFFRRNTTCPRFGASSLDKSECKCTDGLWRC